MSIRDGLEPSRSRDSETHTQPLPGDASTAPGNEASADPGDRPSTPAPPSPGPADDAWPPSWGESPSWGRPPGSPDDPGWTRPSPSPADPTWPQPAAAAGAPTWTEPPGATGPSWTQASGPAAAGSWPEAPGPAAAAQDSTPGSTTQTLPAEAPRTDGPSWTQTQTGPAQGGGHPPTPTWGTRPADGGSPRSRGPSRWLAAVVAGIILLASGYGISQVLDRNDTTTPTGAGIPTAAPPAAAPAPSASGQEPAAAVAKALLPTVVEIRRGNGLGSGFVYDKDGYIMTAAHVVQGTDQVEVRLYDGTELTGKVLGTDELNDVAVVKVNRTGLAAAPLALGETVEVGQLAVAIGSPFGLNETVTAGIISATDRTLEGREVIQTDAPINPGNSGGVLADRRGRVIGINDAIQTGSDSNGNVGIGFAIPIDLAARSATAIVQGKPIQVGYLGVNLAPPAGGQDGALVQEVVPDSPAAKAGLRAGDLVVGIDGQSVADYGELGARIRAHKPGDKITLKVNRGGNETTITATLSRRPAR
jgi:putative serine protease PepD